MKFDKINVIIVTLLFALLELSCIIILIYDMFVDDEHYIEFSLFALNTLLLWYYVHKHKSQISCSLRKAVKFIGKKYEQLFKTTERSCK